MGRRGRPPYPDILTPREWEVLALLREGLTNEAIAARLGISHAAAKYHVSEILSKLGVASREEAAAWQPEAERRRWWAAFGWLRPATVGKAALVAAAVAVLAGLGLLAWGVLRAGEEGGMAGTASAGPRTPPPPSETAGMVFLRNAKMVDPAPVGELWVGETDGARRISPEDRTTFAGLVRAEGRTLLYYVAFVDERERVLREVELESGHARDILTFAARHNFDGSASVSPDGRYAAFTEVDSIWLYGLQSGERWLLLQGNAPACDGLQAVQCTIYRPAGWSPDSKLLLVQKGFYEGAHFVVEDPFAEQPQLAEFGEMTAAYIWGWSPDSQALCMAGQYAAPTSLYVAQSPDWSARRFFAEYESYAETGSLDAGLSVAGCSWPALSHVAVLAGPFGAPRDGVTEAPRLIALDPDSGEARTVAQFEEEQTLHGSLAAEPGARRAVVQFWEPSTGEPRRAFLADLESGQVKEVRGLDGWVVAVAPPRLKAADALQPAAGACAEAVGDIVTITFNPDVPDPRCVKVKAQQRLRIVNGTEGAVQFELGAFAGELTVPGASAVSQPVGMFLAAGVHGIQSTAYAGGGSGEVVVQGGE